MEQKIPEYVFSGLPVGEGQDLPHVRLEDRLPQIRQDREALQPYLGKGER